MCLPSRLVSRLIACTLFLFYPLSRKLALFVHNVYQLVLPYCMIISSIDSEVQMQTSPSLDPNCEGVGEMAGMDDIRGGGTRKTTWRALTFVFLSPAHSGRLLVFFYIHLSVQHTIFFWVQLYLAVLCPPSRTWAFSRCGDWGPSSLQDAGFHRGGFRACCRRTASGRQPSGLRVWAQ